MKAMTDDLRRISVVLFEGFELLDVFGPVELFSMVPDRVAIEFIGPEAGPVASSQGVQVTATLGYDAAATPDIMLIPGGRGTRRLVNDEAFLWVREQSENVGWIAQARWVEDRDRWTSSGVAAGMDMAAALLADLFGKDVAQRARTRAELEVHEDASWDPFAKIHGLAQ
jgi:transcriptional regulator GlxA family with amidase domain